MKRILLALMLVSTLAWVASARAEEPNQALDIIKKMVEASKAVQGASFEVHFEPIGQGKKYYSYVDATCLTWGFKYGMPEKAKFDVKTRKEESDEMKHLGIGVAGEEYYVIDHAEKIAYKDMDPGVLGAMSRPFEVASYEALLESEPYKRELESEQQELKGTETVDGVACHVIHVKYGKGPRRADLYIAKKDFLLRKKNMIFMENDEGVGGLVVTYTNLKVDPKLKDNAFVFELPAGYKLTDDFAP